MNVVHNYIFMVILGEIGSCSFGFTTFLGSDISKDKYKKE